MTIFTEQDLIFTYQSHIDTHSDSIFDLSFYCPYCFSSKYFPQNVIILDKNPKMYYEGPIYPQHTELTHK